MSYVTIPMIAAHAGRTPQAVRDALRAAQFKCEKFKGVRGFRIERKEANKFLSKHWPQVGPMTQPGAVK